MVATNVAEKKATVINLDTGLDPITFQILKNRLVAINEEAATTMKLVSGSTVATEANDMNTAILNAEGDVVAVARYSLAKATTMSEVVKDILANYQENPGINEGDAFITNDVYLGVQHQNDVALVMPFFVDGELVAWTGAEVHELDVGGPVAGSVQIGAKDIYGEAPLMPPTKIIENHIIKKDVERHYVRMSRVPGAVSLDLRAKFSACSVAIQRLQKLVDRYSLSTVKAAMSGSLDYAEAKFRALLRGLPDGTWRHITYLDYDGDTYPIKIAMTKTDDRLIFDFTGTAKQAPAVINCTRKSLIAVSLGYVCISLGWDTPWSPSALDRMVEYVTEPGTIVDCVWPAGCCKSTTSVSWSVGKATGLLLGRMLACSDDTRAKAMSSWIGSMTAEELFGTNDDGSKFGGIVIDAMSGAGGARTFKDGIDTGGYLGSMGMAIANVESYEVEHPILYLYRRQQSDGGGAGAYRGGTSLCKAYTPHGIDEISSFVVHCMGVEMPLSPGMYGGYPAGTNQLVLKRDTNVRELLSGGSMPTNIAEMSGSEEVQNGISRNKLSFGDVFQGTTMGAGGYGDPLQRDPETVLQDNIIGLASEEVAQSMYGVVLENGGVNQDKTAALREQIRRQRLENASEARSAPVSSEGLTQVLVAGQQLQLLSDGSNKYIACACSRVLAPANENYKEWVAESRKPLSAAGPHCDPYEKGAATFELREYYCPGCATLLEVDMVEKTESIVWDLELA